jgi:hypothetical protein
MAAPKDTDKARQADAAEALYALAVYISPSQLVSDLDGLTKDDWKAIAENAGKLQRRARTLAGMKRGG